MLHGLAFITEHQPGLFLNFCRIRIRSSQSSSKNTDVKPQTVNVSDLLTSSLAGNNKVIQLPLAYLVPD